MMGKWCVILHLCDVFVVALAMEAHKSYLFDDMMNIASERV